MTLGFSQEIKGVKNLGKPFDNTDEPIKPKLHTIRAGEGRWRAGMDIHMVINNRTKNRFQFAPTIKCKSVQKIEIVHTGNKTPIIWVSNGKNLMNALSYQESSRLAINDGFDSIEDFFNYFNKDFTGTIIHWTDLRY